MQKKSGPLTADQPRVIDAHVHVWDLTGGPFGVDYPWLGPHLPILNRTFTLAEVEPELATAGVDGIVLVQASDSAAETVELLRVAATTDLPARVVGWLPLHDAAATAAVLQQVNDPTLTGARHLIHDEADPQWMLRPDVAAGMDLLVEAGLSFDAVAERPDLLAQIPLLAKRHPGLTIVVDHLGKPPIAAGTWQPWADLLSAAAEQPNVVAKLSGLGTVSSPGWTAIDWQPYVEHALAAFGPDRLMVGGDWPFALQAADYSATWAATAAVLAHLPPSDLAAVMGANACRIYRFCYPVCPVTCR